jgi:hypothetical protein
MRCIFGLIFSAANLLMKIHKNLKLETKIYHPINDIGLELAAKPICFRYGITIPFSTLGTAKKVFPNFALGLVID